MSAGISAKIGIVLPALAAIKPLTSSREGLTVIYHCVEKNGVSV